MRTIAFDIWGDYAHFRVFWSTSSPLTFSFIPPPTIFGIIGAFLGLDKNQNDYLKILTNANCKVGLEIRNPIRKVRMGMNIINTKGKKFSLDNANPRTQLKYEFVRFPRYRIFVSMEDEQLMKQLSDSLRHHKSFYTISLGLSELLADFAFVDEFDVQKVTNYDKTEIRTVLNTKFIDKSNIELSEGLFLKKETVHTQMDYNRIVSRYDDFIYDNYCKPIKVLAPISYKSDKYNILWMNYE